MDPESKGGTLMDPLILDERDNLQGQPGLHALIVGTSAYPHLPKGTGKPALDSLGMSQLTSPARTGYEICDWLMRRKDRLPVPLATIRMLLAPSPTELRIEPKLSGMILPCTWSRFEHVAKEWRNDAGSNRGNMTFFYFAGHGVQRIRAGRPGVQPGEHVLLLEDFGDGIGTLLAKAVNSTELIAGMAPSNKYPDIARTQLYFLDSCRITPKKFREYEDMPTGAFWDIYERLEIDDRVNPIFYTAVPGRTSFGLKGDQTIFSKALLQCLNGGAGMALDDDHQDQERWGISIDSLNATLQYHIDQINKKMPGARQEFKVDGLGTGSHLIIHRLDAPPLIDIVLEVDPEKACSVIRVRVLNDQDDPIRELPVPLQPHPYKVSLPAGLYRVSAKIDPITPPYVTPKPKTYQVKPPQVPLWRVKVTSQ
jgi:hypothetical protein